MSNYIIVIRLGPSVSNHSIASTRALALLRAHVPLTLLLDLTDPAGPDSRAILLAELVDEDVRLDRIVLPDSGPDFVADLDVC